MFEKTYRIPQKVKVKKKGLLFNRVVEEERMIEVDRKTWEKWKNEQNRKQFEEDLYMGLFDDE